MPGGAVLPQSKAPVRPEDELWLVPGCLVSQPDVTILGLEHEGPDLRIAPDHPRVRTRRPVTDRDPCLHPEAEQQRGAHDRVVVTVTPATRERDVGWAPSIVSGHVGDVDEPDTAKDHGRRLGPG